MFRRDKGLFKSFVRIQKRSPKHGIVHYAEKISGFCRKKADEAEYRFLHTVRKRRQDKSVFRATGMYISHTAYDNTSVERAYTRRRLHIGRDVGI